MHNKRRKLSAARFISRRGSFLRVFIGAQITGSDFNAPPVHQTPFLFIGYRRGGGADDFKYETHLGSHLTWPPESEYATASWSLARHMRNMFHPAVNLERCVGLNAIFLRCPNITEYTQNLDTETRQKVERFCLERVHRIIDAIDPQKIVTIGFSTLKLFGGTEPHAINAKGRVLTRGGQIGGRGAIAMLHLSGARISKEDRARIRDSVLADWGPQNGPPPIRS